MTNLFPARTISEDRHLAELIKQYGWGSIARWFNVNGKGDIPETLTEFQKGCSSDPEPFGKTQEVPISTYWTPDVWKKVVNTLALRHDLYVVAKVNRYDRRVLVPYDNGSRTGIYLLTEEDFAALRPRFCTGDNGNGVTWANAFDAEILTLEPSNALGCRQAVRV